MLRKEIMIFETSSESAYRGSFYTILGAGGDLAKWTDGYDKLLVERGIGKPTTWYRTTGAAINRYAVSDGSTNGDPFADDLIVLMFPLDGLDLGKLAFFRIQKMDRWFDDIIDNMRR